MVKKDNSKKNISRIKKLSETVKIFAGNVYIGRDTYSALSNKLISLIKIIIVSTKKFISDDCLTHASSIAYTVILSLIPTLAVMLTFYSGLENKKEELFRKILVFITEHNIKINVEPIFSAISGLVDNAGKIGGIGAVVLIFSATAMLRTFEKSLNDIWKVKKSRPVFLQIIYYWAALTLGPIMFIAAATVSSELVEFFSPPAYNSGTYSGEKFWAVGNKAKILYREKKTSANNEININNIDFNNQKNYEFNPTEKNFIELDFKLEISEFQKIKLKDIVFINNSGWIIGESGILLSSSDNGETWSISKLGDFKFNSIKMIDNQKGFIACDNGFLLSTNDGGRNWNLIEWDNFRHNLNSITVSKDSIYIASGAGMLLKSHDLGITWESNQIKQAGKNDRSLSLNSITIDQNNNLWIAGDEGLILLSKDSGKTWEQKKFKDYNYYTIKFIDKKKGYIGGSDGIFLSSIDGGATWLDKKFPSSRINKTFYGDEKIFILGDSGLLMSLDLLTGKLEGTQGTSIAALLINFFAPFSFIWLLFLLAYVSLPNTKIPIKYAAIGASFTGTVWVIFILLFIIYTKSFANGTFAIYGALASIPLLLLMIYSSIVIVLYGAEVSYTLMHPETYANLKKAFSDKIDLPVYYGIALLCGIYKKFESGKGHSNYSELIKSHSVSAGPIDDYLDIYVKSNLINIESDGTYSPTNSSRNIRISKVIDITDRISFDIPEKDKSPYKNLLKSLFDKIKKSNADILGDITVFDMINTHNTRK
jgi:membrane protein